MVRPTSALLAGAGSTNLRFEVRSLHGHEIPGVGAAERAVHALALLQNGIGDLDRAAHRLAAHRIEGAEADRDRRDAA